jgi:DNA-binding response OmpR family regulator
VARVLIIDDDVALRQVLTKHLERAGHDVRQAADGDAGIRAFERQGADVVLVDIFMPVQGGLQTIGRLRQKWPGVKIVAISGVSSAGALDVERHAVTLGADRFVGKPLDASALVALVADLAKEGGGG